MSASVTTKGELGIQTPIRVTDETQALKVETKAAVISTIKFSRHYLCNLEAAADPCALSRAEGEY